MEKNLQLKPQEKRMMITILFVMLSVWYILNDLEIVYMPENLETNYPVAIILFLGYLAISKKDKWNDFGQ